MASDPNEKLEMTALITAKPGLGAKLEVALKEVVALTIKEPGCLEFRVFKDLEHPDRFVLWEVFENREALIFHINQDYTKAYFANGLLERTQVLKLRSLS